MTYTIALKRSYAAANPNDKEEFPTFANLEDAQTFIEENGIEADYYSIVKVKDSPQSLPGKEHK